MYWQLLLAKETAIRSLSHSQNVHQQSINDFWSCKSGNYIVAWLLLGKTDVLAAFISKRDSDMDTAPFRDWAWTEHERFLVSFVWELNRDLVTVRRNKHVGSFHRQKRMHYGHCTTLTMSGNGASTILNFASWVIKVPIGSRHPLMRYWQLGGAIITATPSLRHPENECQRRVNNSWSCIFSNQGIACIFEHITELLTYLIS